MSVIDTVVSAVGGVVFVAWLVSTYFWVRRGCPMPKWLHVFGVGACAGRAGLGAWLVALGGRPIWIALACGLGFPAAVYVGWLWMFGPDWAGRR